MRNGLCHPNGGKEVQVTNPHLDWTASDRFHLCIHSVLILLLDACSFPVDPTPSSGVGPPRFVETRNPSHAGKESQVHELS